MRRILLLVALTLAALAVVPGVASADVQMNLGQAPPQGGWEEVLEGRYITLSANNQVAQNGPKVGFFTSAGCSGPAETSVFIAHAIADIPDGGPPEGGGSAVKDCDQGGGFVFVIALRSQAPFFNSANNLYVRLVGLSFDAANQQDDLEFQQECLSPLDSDEEERFCE